MPNYYTCEEIDLDEAIKKIARYSTKIIIIIPEFV